MKEFRVKMTEEDYERLTEIKKRFGFYQNKEVFNKFLDLAENITTEQEIAQNLRYAIKQIGFTKKQVGILSEMISEYFSYKGIKAVGYGIEADVYKSAEKLVEKRINNQMQKNHGRIL
ncbi:hypothetical protein GA0061071_1283 [Kosakonia oryzendophytica]|uniref:Uncharacterized protein n=4 Tax=Bacteria TaxID=2 RepID=A0A1C4EFT4_9ENTR|nr:MULTISPECIES: hypothetical protein [Kosakonia]SCC42469.1 hypothetical protein GA0061071_1283 [Kosakonia oryzendophytica]SCC70089.1 hypothetical protein GA0061070_11123 [Kosakonia oryziphila]